MTTSAKNLPAMINGGGGGVETPSNRFCGERSRTVKPAKTALALFFILFIGSSLMKTYSQGLVQANGNDIAYTMRRFGVQMNNPVLPFEVNGSGKFYKNLFVDSLFTSWHIQTQQIEAGTATITGDLTAQKLTVTSTVLFNSLSGTGNGLVGVDATGELKRYNMTGNVNDYFRGDGTFGNLSIATGWQLVGGTLVSTVNDVAIPGTLSVGHSINIGSFRFKNSALINEADTLITDRDLKIMTLADKIALEADTVTMREFTRVGSDTSKYAPPVTGKVALEVAGSATVVGDLAVKGGVSSNEVKTNTITTNNLMTNSAISSPKVITSHITSQDSILMLGDSTIYINQTNNRIYTLGEPLHIYSINETMRISAFGTNGELRLQTAAGSGNTIIGNAVGIGTYSITSGTMLDVVNKFQVNTSGDLVKINNVSYAWPSIQGAAGSLLKNDGSGGLSWVNSGNSSSPVWSVTGNTGTTTGTNFIGTTDAVDFVIKTNSSEKMRVMGTGTHPGNMGLGTSNPQKKLHIRTTHNITGIGTDESDANDAVGTHQGIRLENWDAGSSSIWDIEPIVNNSESKFTIGQPTTPRLTINSSGNVGIGTSSPSEKLDVNGNISLTSNTDRKIFMQNNDGITFGLTIHSTDMDDYGSGGKLVLRGGNAGDPGTGGHVFIFGGFGQNGSSGNVILAHTGINPSGKVGIGTTDPQYPLDVKGIIRSCEILIADPSWCDFVYKKGYYLQPFRQRMNDIWKNERMPYMLSENEIKKNGAPVAQSFAGLLQNTEELYLYVDWLEKRTTTLEEEKDFWKKKFEEIDKRLKAVENR